MRSTFIIVASSALGAMAGPVVKRDLTTTTVVETFYTTVTCDEDATSTSTETLPTGGTIPDTTSAYSSSVYSSSVQPEPTTTYTPPVVTVYPSTSEQPSTTQEYTAPATTAPTYTAPATTASQPASSTSGSSDPFVSTALYHHNVHRANNSASAMSWSEQYAGYAAQIASSCVFAHNMGVGTHDYGQNIAMFASTDLTGVDEESFIARSITDMWYNGEIDCFPSDGYGQASPDQSNFECWGHYSQVIWGGSTQVGCAVQYCPAGTIDTYPAYFSVCNYYPAGNVFGDFNTNVFQPQGQPSVNA